MAMSSMSKQWTRVRTLGRGASGAEVFLAADDASGQLFAVKSSTAGCASALRREQSVMSGLSSPRVLSCIGGRSALDGSYQLFLEYAPGGSLAEQVASKGGLDERAVRGYAADVAAGLAYLHGAGMVHGDIKARNVVIGADGRAKLADFGCSREAAAGQPIIGGTPAFMAPEVARGEEQGPAADVWALGCTVVEMATGRAPWSGMYGDALAALHRIGYTEAVPEVPQWLSAEAKDFLGSCLVRQASGRCTAAQLLEHPFLASAGVLEAKPQAIESKWVSPKSTLDAEFWESESDAEEEAEHESTAERRIMALACTALPDWDSDEGWIDVLSAPTTAPDALAVAAKEIADITVDDAITTSEEEWIDAESGVVDITGDVEYSGVLSAGEEASDNDDSVVGHSRHQPPLEILVSHELSCKVLLPDVFCNRNTIAIDLVLAQNSTLSASRCSSASPVYASATRSISKEIPSSRGRDSD